MLPTLLRHAAKPRISDGDLRELEADLFFEFQARARDLHDRTLSDWDVLFFMRHHGVATRLLDWTETFSVALYFALREWVGATTPCIWLLNPWALNEHEDSWEVRDLVSPVYLGGEGEYEYSDFMVSFDDLTFGWKHPVALYPMQRNPRLHAQKGYFTIFGDDRRLLDAINPDVVSRLDLPIDAIPAAKDFLILAGVDDYSMFPDLDGLRRSLHAKHEIEGSWL